MRAISIGAHVGREDPLTEAKAREADIVQFFLGNPQSWKEPRLPADRDALRAAEIDLYVHSPYLVNVATSNNRIRIPSRKILTQHAEAAADIGAKGLIVHGGHVLKDDDPAIGYENWRKTFERTEFRLPVLIENTAGGDNAMTRRLDSIARLWDALEGHDVGFCLDTCHAHAGGEELLDIVDRIKSITGRIDLVHCNNSKDAFDSGRDRHENLETGEIASDLLVAVVKAAGAPVICETPGGTEGQARDISWLREQAAKD